MTTTNNDLSEALRACLFSPAEMDINLESANVVDGLFAIARAINGLSSTMEKVAGNMDNLAAIAVAIENRE